MTDYKNKGGIRRYLKKKFPDTFEEAQMKFVESLAGYSLFGLMMNHREITEEDMYLDSEGHLILTDF